VHSHCFVMNTGRTTKQGVAISAGKLSAEYEAVVSTLTMNPDDMKSIGIPSGAHVVVRSPHGEATFICVEGKIPPGMVFAPYGPRTSRLMGPITDATGTPVSKGLDVEVAIASGPELT
jgi:formylmethanofuran dehydrogenase subunit D